MSAKATRGAAAGITAAFEGKGAEKSKGEAARIARDFSRVFAAASAETAGVRAHDRTDEREAGPGEGELPGAAVAQARPDAPLVRGPSALLATMAPPAREVIAPVARETTRMREPMVTNRTVPAAEAVVGREKVNQRGEAFAVPGKLPGDKAVPAGRPVTRAQPAGEKSAAFGEQAAAFGADRVAAAAVGDGKSVAGDRFTTVDKIVSASTAPREPVAMSEPGVPRGKAAEPRDRQPRKPLAPEAMAAPAHAPAVAESKDRPADEGPKAPAVDPGARGEAPVDEAGPRVRGARAAREAPDGLARPDRFELERSVAEAGEGERAQPRRRASDEARPADGAALAAVLPSVAPLPAIDLGIARGADARPTTADDPALADLVRGNGRGKPAEGPEVTGAPARDPERPPTLPLPLFEAPLPAPGAPPTAAETVSAPPPALAAPPELAHLPEDPGLALSIMPRAAHLTIEGENGRALELHVRLLPEGADIRASGELASLMQGRSGELGQALAAEGVTLGRFELGGREGDGRERQGREREQMIDQRNDLIDGARAQGPRRPTAPVAEEAPVVRTPGRIHVKV